MLKIKKKHLPFFLNPKDIAYWTGKWQSYRRVLVHGELTHESVRTVELELLKLASESNEPILLMISSPGGDVVPSQQLMDTIGSLNSPIDAMVIGNCSSMAVDIVQICRKRFALPSSRLLLHYVREGQGWVCDDIEQLKKDLALFLERTENTANRRMKLYTERTGMSREKIFEIMRHGEVHRARISAEQALELKLIDEIVTDFKIFPTGEADEKK